MLTTVITIKKNRKKMDKKSFFIGAGVGTGLTLLTGYAWKKAKKKVGKFFSSEEEDEEENEKKKKKKKPAKQEEDSSSKEEKKEKAEK
jgi:hypothetical protein